MVRAAAGTTAANLLANVNYVMQLLLLEHEDPWAQLADLSNGIRSSGPTSWTWLRACWPRDAALLGLKLGADVRPAVATPTSRLQPTG